jgi:hypothetical protein
MTNVRGPALLIGIDTEGDNQWDVRARRHQTFENIYALGRLHEFFERHSVRPTYFVTYPVASDAQSAGVLRGIEQHGNAEIAAHHHAWETPPCGADDVERHSYALSLPLSQFDAQLDSLTARIAQAVGRQPVSYRSGRFGFCAAHVSSLEHRGYVVDSSVVPLFYEAHKGGPDFAGAPLEPYFLSYDAVTHPGSSSVMELPVSAALNRRLSGALARLYARAPWPYQTKRVLRLLGLAELQVLRPSLNAAAKMIDLAKRLAREGQPLLNLFFHSSEAIAGGSPYNRTTSEVDAFFERLAAFLDFAVRELHAAPMTFQEFRQAHLRTSSAGP